MAQQELETSLADIARAAAVLFREGRMPISVGVWYSDGFSWLSGLGSESLSPAEWEPALADTLKTALARTRHNHRRPVCVAIWFSDHSCVHHSLPPREWSVEGWDDLSHCKQDITRVLHETKHRLTTSQILQRLQAQDLLWGESTVKRALAEMVRHNELNNRHDIRPRGYGLPAWG